MKLGKVPKKTRQPPLPKTSDALYSPEKPKSINQEEGWTTEASEEEIQNAMKLHAGTARGKGRKSSGEKCPHGKLLYYCKLCKGAGICVHSRIKHYCTLCGGKQICPHGKIKRYCKECGGAQICKHGISRYRCKPCGGYGTCIHGKQKIACRECGGSKLCNHGTEKYYCKQCGGRGICTHNKIRYNCKICRPNVGSARKKENQSNSAGSQNSKNLTHGSWPSVSVGEQLVCDRRLPRIKEQKGMLTESGTPVVDHTLGSFGESPAMFDITSVGNLRVPTSLARVNEDQRGTSSLDDIARRRVAFLLEVNSVTSTCYAMLDLSFASHQ